MRILLTNSFISQRTGSEVFLADLVTGLRRRGHEIALYAPELGKLADELTVLGCTVVSEPAQCPWRPDVIHGQHFIPTTRAALAFPSVPVLNICHGAIPHEEEPCLAPNVRCWVAVDLACQQRIRSATGRTADQVPLLQNAVRLDLFPERLTFAERPRRALVFGNTAHENERLATLRSACTAAGMELHVAGSGVAKVCDEPWKLLPEFDLVFAKGRCALEAMACGCSVIVSDERGLGPAVTAANYDVLRAWNFGYMLLSAPHTAELLTSRLQDCCGIEAAAVMRIVRSKADHERNLDDWEAAYARVATSLGASDTAMLKFAQSLVVAPDRRPSPEIVVKEGESFGMERRRRQVLTKTLGKTLSEIRNRASSAWFGRKAFAGLTNFVAAQLNKEARAFDAEAREQLEAGLGITLTASVPPLPLPFIVGFPRSGTTWLRLTLDAHPLLAIPAETGFITEVPQLAGWGSKLREAFADMTCRFPREHPHFGDYGLDESAFRSALAKVEPFNIADGLRTFYRLIAEKSGKPRAGDKTPVYGQVMPLIARYLPEAHFVHLIRDGRDCVASLREQGFSPSKNIAELARRWAADTHQAQAQGSKLPNYLQVRYEELVLNREATLRRICSFLQLPWDEAVLNHQANARARLAELPAVVALDGVTIYSTEQRNQVHAPATEQPITERIGAWRHRLKDAELATFEAIAGQALLDFGYALEA